VRRRRPGAARRAASHDAQRCGASHHPSEISSHRVPPLFTPHGASLGPRVASSLADLLCPGRNARDPSWQPPSRRRRCDPPWARPCPRPRGGTRASRRWSSTPSVHSARARSSMSSVLPHPILAQAAFHRCREGSSPSEERVDETEPRLAVTKPRLADAWQCPPVMRRRPPRVRLTPRRSCPCAAWAARAPSACW